MALICLHRDCRPTPLNDELCIFPAEANKVKIFKYYFFRALISVSLKTHSFSGRTVTTRFKRSEELKLASNRQRAQRFSTVDFLPRVHGCSKNLNNNLVKSFVTVNIKKIFRFITNSWNMMKLLFFENASFHSLLQPKMFCFLQYCQISRPVAQGSCLRIKKMESLKLG